MGSCWVKEVETKMSQEPVEKLIQLGLSEHHCNKAEVTEQIESIGENIRFGRMSRR